MNALLEFLEQRNQQQDEQQSSGNDSDRTKLPTPPPLPIQTALIQRYRSGLVPCFQFQHVNSIPLLSRTVGIGLYTAIDISNFNSDKIRIQYIIW